MKYIFIILIVFAFLTAAYFAQLDWRLIFSIGIPAAVVIVGWFFVNKLNARRELASRKREARIKAMETAYMRLATTSNRPMTDKIMDEIETFVSELQLYGTPRQIELMGQIVEGLKKPGNFVPYDELLINLRDMLRRELDLEPISTGIWWLRFDRKKEGNDG